MCKKCNTDSKKSDRFKDGEWVLFDGGLYEVDGCHKDGKLYLKSNVSNAVFSVEESQVKKVIDLDLDGVDLDKWDGDFKKGERCKIVNYHLYEYNGSEVIISDYANGSGKYLIDDVDDAWWMWIEPCYLEKVDKKSDRKSYPLYSGVIKYFPDALLELSKVSVAGNKQHENGDELEWDRGKSNDHLDSLMRHLADHAKGGYIDDDGLYHISKVAWRACAALQEFIEKEIKS